MPRYIDQDKLVNRLDEHYVALVKKCGFDDAYARGYGDAISDVNDEPAVDVREVKHGKWTIRYEGTYKRAKCYCSVCGKPNGIGGIISNQKKPYCPNCGSKMDLEDDK